MKYFFAAIIIIIIIVLVAYKLSEDTPKSNRNSKPQPIPSNPRITPVPRPEKEIDASRLHDSHDKVYVLAQEEVVILQQTRNSVKKAVECRRDIDLSLSFFDEVNALVKAAENIRKNANVSRIHDSTFHYYSELWFRSVLASNMLERAEHIVGDKVLYLHKINFSTITPEQRKTIMRLQRELPKYQSLLAKKKIALWNNNKHLKEIIRNSGARGRRWYNELNERIEQKKLTHK